METGNDSGRSRNLSWPECALILCDRKGLVSDWDSQAECFFGWSGPEAVGRPLRELILPAPPNSSAINAHIESARLFDPSSEGESREMTMAHRDGRVFLSEIMTRKIRQDGAYLVLVRDAVCRKNYHKQAEHAGCNQKIIDDILVVALSSNSWGERLQHILDYVLQLPRLNLLPVAGVFGVDLDSRKLVLKTHRGFSSRHKKECLEVPFGTCPCGKAAQLGTIQFSRCNAAASLTICGQTDPRSHLCVPIMNNDSLAGLVCFYPAGDSIGSAEEALLKDICNIIGNILAAAPDSGPVHSDHESPLSIMDLRNEIKFSESIIQGLNHGLLVVDRQGNIQKSNSIARSILQPFAPTLQGENLFDIVGDEAAEQMMCSGDSSSLQLNNEITLATSGGDKKVISYKTFTRDDTTGNQVGLIISMTDISEVIYVRREMEKMNRLSTIAEIAAAVAHEVRNPLAGIKIMAQSIEEQSVTIEEQKECSRRIVRQVDRLNELLTDFFSYARPAPPKIKPVSITQILSETRHLVSNKLTSKHITYTYDHQQNLPLVEADPHQLQQVFLNLFLNAIDAVRSGGIIKITAMQLSKSALSQYKKKYPGLLAGDRYVRLYFYDNGAGMSVETMEKAFEPFFTTKNKGAGLGLSIVYRTLKENGAAILVDSVEGQGATFTLFFRIPE
ncbi:MAG: ATP-binding protein [Desulfocapsaceae bacterium]|nr:ATP-binding protein [Desulfocapsaceae bacterium]